MPRDIWIVTISDRQKENRPWESWSSFTSSMNITWHKSWKWQHVLLLKDRKLSIAYCGYTNEYFWCWSVTNGHNLTTTRLMGYNWAIISFISAYRSGCRGTTDVFDMLDMQEQLADFGGQSAKITYDASVPFFVREFEILHNLMLAFVHLCYESNQL